ncbi:MAG: HEAT repeat domain-containing protein [Planctomycetes bacterium]|nr:HEAT repeat domain-containing protein [Planctomycetota bacterium]MCB9886032.1 HEAT repeat domain-containing protein [Planctomycetota bacterium]
MGLLTICLVSSFLPQGPSTDSVAAPQAVVHPASWLPAHCAVAVMMSPDPEGHFDADGLRRVLASDPSGSLEHFTTMLDAELAAHGLSTQDAADLQRGGVAVALHGWSATGVPSITLVGRCPTSAERLHAALQAQGHTTRVDSVDCREFGEGESTFVGGIFGEYLILTTARETLSWTIAATQGDQEQSLEHASDYQDTLAECGTAAPQVQVFARPAQLFTELRAHAAAKGIDLGRIAAALELDKIDRALVGASRGEGGMRLCGTIHAPRLGGLLAALGGTSIRFDQTLAAIVPEAATAFGLSTIDLGAVIRAGVAVVAAVDAETGAMARETMESWGKKHGLDVGADLLDSCSGRIATMQLPSGKAVAIGVRNKAAWAHGVEALLADLGQQVSQREFAGTTVQCIEDPFGATTVIGMVGDWLCIAEGEMTFQALQQQGGSNTPAAMVTAALAAAPENTTHLAVERASGQSTFLRRTETGMTLSNLQGTPTEIVASTTPEETTADEATHGKDEAARRDLHAVEAAGNTADIAELTRLARCGDDAVARRAAWLLGKHAKKEKLQPLQDLAHESTDAEIRLLAMAALVTAASPGSLETAVDALDDADQRVRVAGAQLLGRLRKPAAKEPLLAFLQRSRNTLAQAEDTSDVQAALVALHDLGAKEELLPATTTLRDATQKGVGQALAFYWQGVSPQFPREQETTLLLAALDHSALLLRRYAIDRLAELNSTSAVPALEKRLGTEGPELRPLIESTLSYLRRDQDQPKGDEYERAMANAQALWAKTVATWKGLDDNERMVYGGGAGGLVLVLFLAVVMVRRRRRKQEHEEAAAAAAALAAPSDDYYDEAYEEGAEYYEDAEAGYDEQVYEDAGSYR